MIKDKARSWDKSKIVTRYTCDSIAERNSIAVSSLREDDFCLVCHSDGAVDSWVWKNGAWTVGGTFSLPTSNQGPPGPKGEPFTFNDLTPAQIASLKGAKGDPGTPGAPGPKGESGTSAWGSITNRPKAFPPSDHAANHGINGSDSITPSLIGALSETGTAVAANKLAIGRTLTLAGAVTGSVRFDGTTDVKITTDVPDTSPVLTDVSTQIVATAVAGAYLNNVALSINGTTLVLTGSRYTATNCSSNCNCTSNCNCNRN